jgi:type II restriction enzyme
MRLELDAAAGSSYTSASQWARSVTEAWAAANLYCLACTSNRFLPHIANTKVEDYHCPKCARRLQVKAKRGSIGKVVANSAYAVKIAAIMANRAPDYCFLGYDRDALLVSDVVWVPGHFVTLGVISKRKPLAPTARRAGWVGSNIHLDRIPDAGKIPVVVNGEALPSKVVRREFAKTLFVARLPAEKRGWLSDVMNCLDELKLRRGSQFHLSDVYALAPNLQALHPANKNIEPKIRQQLQVLERNGLVRRIRPGRYERL